MLLVSSSVEIRLDVLGRILEESATKAYLKLGVAAENDLWAVTLVVEEGRVGHGHPRHVVIVPSPIHPHLLGKGANRRNSGAVELKLLEQDI